MDKRYLPKLTDQQAAVLEYIYDYSTADPLGRPPTYKKIAVHFGLAMSTVWHHVDNLREHKCIHDLIAGERNVIITDTGMEAARALKNHAESNGQGTQGEKHTNGSGSKTESKSKHAVRKVSSA